MKKVFLAKLAGSVFYIGFVPKAPGTMGSVFAVLVYALILIFCDNYLLSHILFTALFIVLSFIAGIYAKEAFNSKKDPKEFVLDEVAGQMIALFPLSIVGVYNSYLIFLSFCLFRFFDIVKPFPVAFFDKKFDNSFGITMDDVVAGVCASIITFAVLLLFF